MKARFYHYRILNEDYLQYKQLGLNKGKPALYDLLAYNRKQSQFLDPYIAHFETSPNGGMTKCVLYDEFSGMSFTGYSLCSLADSFNYRIGRELAHERAYKEYLNNVPY